MSIFLLSSCGGLTDDEIQSGHKSAQKGIDAKFFMWDGIAVNLNSVYMKCLQDERFSISIFGMHRNTMVTSDCQIFKKQLKLCNAARDDVFKETIRKQCFEHKYAQRRSFIRYYFENQAWQKQEVTFANTLKWIFSDSE